jgi:hypothetical protein
MDAVSLPNPRCLSDEEFAHYADLQLQVMGLDLPTHWQHNAVERIRELLRLAEPVPYFEEAMAEADAEITGAIHERG